MDVVVFDVDDTTDADLANDNTLCTSLTFRRLVEKGIIDAQTAEIFSSMIDPPIIASTIIEVAIQYILQYVSPIRGDGLYITVATYMAPYGISDGIMLCGFLGVPMKPRRSMAPHTSCMDVYAPHTAVAYTLDDVSVLMAFFQYRMPIVYACIQYDRPSPRYVQCPTVHVLSVPAKSTTAEQHRAGMIGYTAPPGKEVRLHLAQIKQANINYSVQHIMYNTLTSYAKRRYNMVWADLDKSQREMLAFEFAKREAEVQKQRENKCGHKILLRTLIAAVDGNSRGVRIDYIMKTHAALTEYYAQQKTDESNIVCNNCKCIIMCRHFEMLCKTRSASAVARVFGESTGAVFSCKLCGEYITYNTTLLESLDLAGHAMYRHSDVLSKQVYRACINQMYQYVVAPARNFSEFVFACIDIILPRIRNKLTIKYVKFFNLDKVEKYTQVVISAYCVAFIIRAMMQYPDILPRAVIEVPDTTSGREAAYLEYFYGTLTKLMYTQITAVMTFEEFGTMLYRAYKAINVAIELSDAFIDAQTYNNMCICGYVQFALKKPKLPPFADIAALLQKIDTPHVKTVMSVHCPAIQVHPHMIHIAIQPSLVLPEVCIYMRQIPVTSGEIYDKRGQPHEWIKDTCRVCGETRSSVAGTNVDAAIYSMGIAESFYNAFMLNCPEGGQHTSTPCTKCKMDDQYSVAIIDKYKKVYANLMHTPLIPLQIAVSVAIQTPEWTLNRAIFLEFEKLYKQPMARIKNIGLVCGILLRQIESGEINPSANAANHRTQGNVVFQYTTILSNMYGKLRRVDIDADSVLKTIANKYPDDIALLPALVPLDYITYSVLDDTAYANCMIVYFFNLLIWFNKPGLLCEFGRYFVRYIFEYDALFSKTDLQPTEYISDDYGLEPEIEEDGMYDDMDMADNIKTNIGFVD